MTSLTLPARCDRGAAEALLPDIVAALGQDSVLSIDGSAVTHVGQAMLQVLSSVRSTQGNVTIAASPALIEAAALTGLTSRLFDEGEAA